MKANIIYVQIVSYNNTNERHQFLKFIFGIALYVFRTGFLSIIRSLVLYAQQYVYVIRVMLTACLQAVNITWEARTKMMGN